MRRAGAMQAEVRVAPKEPQPRVELDGCIGGITDGPTLGVFNRPPRHGSGKAVLPLAV